jgi:hypothetical protein
MSSIASARYLLNFRLSCACAHNPGPHSLQHAKGERPPQRTSVRECAGVCAIAGHACISCDDLNILSARWHEICNMQAKPAMTADIDPQAFNSDILELESAPFKDFWHHRQHGMIFHHHISLISHGMPFYNWCTRSEIREYVQQFGHFLRLKERESGINKHKKFGVCAE